MLKKRVLVSLGICLVLLLVLPLALACKAPATTPAPAPTVTVTAPAPTVTVTAAAPITLKVLRAYPWDANDTMALREFVARVNEKAKGKLTIKDAGGTEVYPANEQFAPLKLGTVDMLWTSNAYVASPFPETLALMYQFGAGPPELRAAGVIKVLDEIGRKNNGVGVIGQLWFSNGHLWLTKPIKTLADLKTVKVRGLPMYNVLLSELEIPTVTLPFTEVMTALQNRVVDAVAWPSYDLILYGFNQYVKYRLDPPFWRAGWAPFMVNAKNYDAVPADLRKIIEDTVVEVEAWWLTKFEQITRDEMTNLKKGGLTTIKISDDEWREAMKVLWEKALPKTYKNLAPANADRILEITAKNYPPKQVYPSIE
ncbi:MAG: TRAP transporter substrate-binding protein DctP [Chloroflexi bacterium]|nr:TRAP transporter substrate-binding protein DctP [Chloroflexota bacterium]